MRRIITWWNTPVPPRRKGWVALAAALNVAAIQVRTQRDRELRKRVEALEEAVR